MRPTYELIANGKDVTANFEGRLASITVVDESGESSDTLTIEVEDTAGEVVTPSRNMELRLRMGYAEEGLRDFGRFYVDSVRLKGPPDIITITARAALFTGADVQPEREEGAGKKFSWGEPLNTRKTQSHPPQTVRQLLHTLVNLQLGRLHKAPAEILDEALPHLDQNAETNISLITRIARERGYTAKVVDGYVVLKPKDQAITATGKRIPDLPLTPGDVSAYESDIGDRNRYGTVVARWQDVANAALVEERVGDKPPVMILGKTYASKDEAAKAAAAEMTRLRETGAELKLDMPLMVDVVADGRLALSGFRDELNGTWTARRVEHRLTPQSGAITSVTARQSA